MDLQHPDKKMSKSTSTPAGMVLIDDPPEEIRKKIRRAVTDAETEVRYDPKAKPGISNLLEMLAAVTGEAPAEIASRYPSYGALKDDTAEALVELLRPDPRPLPRAARRPPKRGRRLGKGGRGGGRDRGRRRWPASGAPSDCSTARVLSAPASADASPARSR